MSSSCVDETLGERVKLERSMHAKREKERERETDSFLAIVKVKCRGSLRKHTNEM